MVKTLHEQRQTFIDSDSHIEARKKKGEHEESTVDSIGDFRNAPITKPDGKFFGFLEGSRVIEYTLFVFLVGASQIQDETAQKRSFVQPSQGLQGGKEKTQ